MRRSSSTPRRLAALLALFAAAASPPAAADPPKEPPYALDAVPRSAPTVGDLPCPKVAIEAYRGDVVRHKPVIWIHPDFRPHLAAFEVVARDVGVEVYGRAPERIEQLGGYGCRRMRDHAGWLSEHALGNAIDVTGFEFGHLPRGATLPGGLHKSFANAFLVDVRRHWGRRHGYDAVHARFLRTLAERLIARPDVFRVLLGPGYPGHSTHFHFDMAPFRLAQIYDDGRLLGAPGKP